MALLDSALSDSPTATALVAALVVVHEGSALGEALGAVGRQVYELERVIVVGGGAEARGAVGADDWVSTVAEGLEALGSDISHVWLVHDDSLPRPDALRALVHEGGRVGAELVGSKILRAGHPGMLESVGLATDVFEVPATGLDFGEQDQEQYDVLRDVAFVAGSSILVNRVMLERVGGPDPLLEPVMGALDLCQRVRLAGGRVVVVPSAEVLHDGSCAAESKHWRLEAGRLRAMLKAYSPLTLLWVVPFNFILGLLEAIISPLFGRWRLFAFLRAWLWNLVRLPSTIGARRRVERIHQDDELFRFQVRGSTRLTSLSQQVADKAIRLAESERIRSLGHFVETSQETVRRPVVASLLGGVGFALLATRQLWADGVASVGYALPPAASVAAALGAYGGGWNPAGLGSPEPLRPVVGAVSLVQVALFGSGSIALVAILVGAAVIGVIGVARLLGPFGVRPVARYAAGVFLIAGPAARLLAGDGVWHGIVAMAVLPWLLSVAMHRRRTIAAVAVSALLTAVAAAFVPLMLVVPSAALILWALVEPANGLRNVGRSVTGAVLAIPALFPWLGALDDLEFFFTSGPDFYWSATPWVTVMVAVVAAGGLAAAPRPLAQLSGWGALLLGGGAVLARTGSFDWGTDPGAAGMALAGVGMAIIIGSGLEAGARAFDIGGVGRYIRLVGLVAAVLLLLGTITVAIPGRLGFPSKGVVETLSFTAEAPPGRAVFIGDEALMPGGGRQLTPEVSYRVVATPEPRLWEAWLAPERLGDDAIASVLSSALSGGSFRLGEELATFGVGWILATGPGSVVDALDAQLDLLPLAIPDTIVYQVEIPALRAVDESGADWILNGTGYVGPSSGGTVRLAENADSRWAEQWEQDEWGNRVTVDGGVIEFGPIEVLRTTSLVSLAWVGMLVIAVVTVGRWKESG